MSARSPDWMTRSCVCAVLTTVAMLAGCGGSSASHDHPTPTSNVPPAAVLKARQDHTAVSPDIVTADNTFGLNVLLKLQSQQGPVNIALSPLSLSIALQILYNGAAGATQDAMTQTLQLGSLTKQQVNDDNAALQGSLLVADPHVELTIANSLWMHQDKNAVLPAFTQMDADYYGAKLGDLAGAPANVNDWVEEQTHGLITNILPPDDYSSVTAVIANAVYFKGTWTTIFDPTNTRPAPFTLTDGSSTSVAMMHQTGTFAYLHSAGFQMLRLPYGGGRLSMLILLPDTGTSLQSLLPTITADAVDNWAGQMHDQYGEIGLPKFTARSNSNLQPVLRELGMGIVFNCPPQGGGEPVADFSALTSDSVCVTNILHNALVQVDEHGTVAAGATTVVVGPTSAGPGFSIIVDHPFFYAIRDDDTGDLMFIGTLLDPTATSM